MPIFGDLETKRKGTVGVRCVTATVDVSERHLRAKVGRLHRAYLQGDIGRPSGSPCIEVGVDHVLHCDVTLVAHW